jgi:aminoglycoside 3-N-acetyltransferase
MLPAMPDPTPRPAEALVTAGSPRSDHPSRRLVPNGAPLLVDRTRRWVPFDEPFVFDEDFPAVAAAFAADTGLVRAGRVGRAQAAVLPQRPLVDFAAGWFSRHRA